MDGDHEHDWRRGPLLPEAQGRLSWQLICLRCWELSSTSDTWRAERTLPWTEQDYLNNLDRIEGWNAQWPGTQAP